MDECNGTHPTPRCESTCNPLSKITDLRSDKSFAIDAYEVSSRINAIKTEIYENGSVSASFSVYEDFLTYRSGIYQHVYGSYLGGHAVKIIGWGVEAGTQYWIIMNSWNKYWGEDGTFRMIAGYDDCGIESELCTALPKLT